MADKLKQSGQADGLSGSIQYTDSLDAVDACMLVGFFEGWVSPLSPEKHLRLLKGSVHVVLAVDTDTRKVVGFVNALADGINSAFIPLLEVLPEYRNLGIGSELVKRMLDVLSDYPCIDLCCDPPLQSFYKKFGMTPSVGMLIRRRRNYPSSS